MPTSAADAALSRGREVVARAHGVARRENLGPRARDRPEHEPIASGRRTAPAEPWTRPQPAAAATPRAACSPKRTRARATKPARRTCRGPTRGCMEARAASVSVAIACDSNDHRTPCTPFWSSGPSSSRGASPKMTYGGDGGGVGEPFRLSGIESGDYPARVRSTESNRARTSGGAAGDPTARTPCRLRRRGRLRDGRRQRGHDPRDARDRVGLRGRGQVPEGRGHARVAQVVRRAVLSLMVLFQWWHILLASTRYPISDAWINAYRKDCMDSTKARRAARTIARARESIARERSSRRALSLAARRAASRRGCPGTRRTTTCTGRSSTRTRASATPTRRACCSTRRRRRARRRRGRPTIFFSAVARADATPVDPPVARADRVHRHPARAVPVRRGRDLHRRERQGDLADPQLERACVCVARGRGRGGRARSPRAVPPREPRPRADSPSGTARAPTERLRAGARTRVHEGTAVRAVRCRLHLSLGVQQGADGEKPTLHGVHQRRQHQGAKLQGLVQLRAGSRAYCLVAPGSNEIQPCQQCCTEMQPKMYEDQLGRPFCV